MSGPFGRALRDHFHDERTDPLVQFDGEQRRDHPVEEFYFESFDPEPGGEAWIDSQLSGPLLDVGAGAGRDALSFQEEFEMVAIEPSEELVALMDERGVADAREGDMFELPGQFGAGRFDSLLVRGTQLGLAKSMPGLQSLLSDFTAVTTDDGTALVDCYDPTDEGIDTLLGYRSDEAEGLAFRVMSFEYEGEVGETLLFRLFSPERLRAAAAETPWTVADVQESPESSYYMAALQKE